MCSHTCIDCFLAQIKSQVSRREYKNIERELLRWKRSQLTSCRLCHHLAEEEEETISLTEKELFHIFYFFVTVGDCHNICLEQ